MGWIIAGLVFLFAVFQYLQRRKERRSEERDKLETKDEYEKGIESLNAKTLEEQYRATLENELGSILVKEKKMNVIVFRDDDQYTAYCADLDLATAQDSPEEAIEDMILAIREYAEDYMKNFPIYSTGPNRKHHLPLIRQIASTRDDWELREIIEVRYGDIHVSSQ